MWCVWVCLGNRSFFLKKLVSYQMNQGSLISVRLFFLTAWKHNSSIWFWIYGNMSPTEDWSKRLTSICSGHHVPSKCMHMLQYNAAAAGYRLSFLSATLPAKWGFSFSYIRSCFAKVESTSKICMEFTLWQKCILYSAPAFIILHYLAAACKDYII